MIGRIVGRCALVKRPATAIVIGCVLGWDVLVCLAGFVSSGTSSLSPNGRIGMAAGIPKVGQALRNWNALWVSTAPGRDGLLFSVLLCALAMALQLGRSVRLPRWMTVLTLCVAAPTAILGSAAALTLPWAVVAHGFSFDEEMLDEGAYLRVGVALAWAYVMSLQLRVARSK